MAKQYNIPPPTDGKDDKGRFTVNNQWWKMRTTIGREKIFKDPKQMLLGAYDYFKYNEDHPDYINEMIKSGLNAGKIIKIPYVKHLSIRGLCIYWGVNTKYFNDFEKGLKDNKEDNKDNAVFSEVIAHIKDVIENQQESGAVIGKYKENIISRILGLTDKSEHDLTSKGESIKEDKPRIMKVVIKKAADPDEEDEEESE